MKVDFPAKLHLNCGTFELLLLTGDLLECCRAADGRCGSTKGQFVPFILQLTSEIMASF